MEKIVRPRVKFFEPVPQLALLAIFFCVIENLSPSTAGTPLKMDIFESKVKYFLRKLNFGTKIIYALIQLPEAEFFNQSIEHFFLSNTPEMKECRELSRPKVPKFTQRFTSLNLLEILT